MKFIVIPFAAALLCTLGMPYTARAEQGYNTYADQNDYASAAPDSLYKKYGGEKTIQKVVDDAVAGLLADPVEAPYFSNIGKPGHDSADRLKSCLDLQFTVLFGGPGHFPGTSHYRNAPPRGYACRDMMKAHKGMNIPGDVFDKFIADLVSVLKADGVSDSDIAKVAPALTGTKKDIVHNGQGIEQQASPEASQYE